MYLNLPKDLFDMVKTAMNRRVMEQFGEPVEGVMFPNRLGPGYPLALEPAYERGGKVEDSDLHELQTCCS